jgi:hypothetical protein
MKWSGLTFAQSTCARLLVDGREASIVIEASEEEGWAEVSWDPHREPRRVYGVVLIIPNNQRE